MRIELTRVGLLVYLANHYTTRGAPLLLSASFWLEVSGFTVFSFSVTDLGTDWYVSLHICRCISNISRLENQHFLIIILTLSASFWFVVSNPANSTQISLILSLYPLCVAPKNIAESARAVEYTAQFQELLSKSNRLICTQ